MNTRFGRADGCWIGDDTVKNAQKSVIARLDPQDGGYRWGERRSTSVKLLFQSDDAAKVGRGEKIGNREKFVAVCGWERVLAWWNYGR